MRLSENELLAQIDQVLQEIVDLKSSGPQNEETTKLVRERGAVLDILIMRLDALYKRQRIISYTGWAGLAIVSAIVLWRRRKV